jgi:ADP-L-glycero-D-manno-heptose 6-epimerase
MLIITGGAGFIGSNLVHELNRQGATDILVVDNLAPSSCLSTKKFLNLTGARFSDYMDKHEFRKALRKGDLPVSRIESILHQGACSNTLETNGQYMMDNNFAYSKEVLEFALAHRIPLVYASTAAVYGLSGNFNEEPANEQPLNIYGFSKLAFDNYVRQRVSPTDSTVVGLRYFNVYGPHEQHKGPMASVIHRFALQLKQTGTIKMFEGCGKYGNGEQRRDFVFVGDVVKINLFLARDASRHGIVNVGTGQSRSFNEVAAALLEIHGTGKVEYIPFPDSIKDQYQSFTEADLTSLRAIGYTSSISELTEGIRETFLESCPVP